ncbi:hypothetical protein COCOBI_07-1040 [Coccomyxa sp. Obi]|nr:hypothetical protein COCOBI_07-1040 [Coccomyxa sp. Obi]
MKQPNMVLVVALVSVLLLATSQQATAVSNLISGNPWKSYELDSYGSITLYSSRDCNGQSSSVLTARSGNIPGPLQGNTKSFKICN